VTGLNQSFPPQLRLKKAAEFKKVFSNPTKSTDRYFTLLAIRNDLGHPRIGLAIAKKMLKRAVDRNTVKRTVRESFRLQQDTMGNMDIVVLARKDAQDALPEELRKSLEKHWLRLVSKCATH
jgi:ribonuclease P protein component